MRVLFFVLFVTACGAAPLRATTSAPTEAPELCRFEGFLPYAELLDATGTHPLAQGHDLPAFVTLVRGPALRALVSVEGFELEATLAPELQLAAPTRLGPVLYVAARHGVGVVDVSGAGVRIGPRRFVLDEVSLTEPAETTVRCEDLALPDIENTDPDADHEAFGLQVMGARALAPDQPIEVRTEPGGDVAATLAPSTYTRRVAVLAEREGAVRITYHHWTDTFVVGWVESALVLPLPADLGESGVLGFLDQGAPEDFTVCRATGDVTLFAQVIGTSADDGTVTPLPVPGPLERLGTVHAGTPLIRIGDPEGAYTEVRPLPTSTLSVPPSVSWLVLDVELGTECAPEHYDPPSLDAIFGDSE